MRMRGKASDEDDGIPDDVVKVKAEERKKGEKENYDRPKKRARKGKQKQKIREYIHR